MSIPTSSAPPGFTAAALIARPVQLRARNNHRQASTTTASPQANTCAFGSTIPEMWNDSLKYDGRAEWDWLPQISPIAASSTSASPKVSRTDDDGGARRIGRTVST